MNTERAEILNRLQSGEITPDEALRLLETPAAPPVPAIPPTPAAPQRWLRVRVTQLSTGKTRVNVNLPLSLVELGMQIGSRYEPQLEGLDIASALAQVQAGGQGLLVEAEDLEDDERVEVYVD